MASEQGKKHGVSYKKVVFNKESSHLRSL